MAGLRKRRNPGGTSMTGEEENTCTYAEPIDVDEQIKLISELREQAVKDYEYQKVAINYICIFTAGMSLYLSEYHGIPVGLIFRLSSASLHMLAAYVGSIRDPKEVLPAKIPLLVAMVLLSVQIMHLMYTYEHYTRDEWFLPMVLVAGNILTLSVSTILSMDTKATFRSVDELESLQYKFRSA
mmetsp:Transcript_7815/g.11548  ORF Transcript_7815/g.11548 Transcript_7815/m.11548 type:complete len:183 (-) Transcript_7815:362-910(-)|eukprot:CAMPEP_0196812074 /NCGR_PEP_ID=MMETSP1362-20130617/20218_1 /TAXON_ID=163516 /ORGANISM="Leptocylindrus danicus, Strain CCMP1856" /LENGTH=182 /DNA_ID=CAMNT_0042187491 /DNA_START=174 /DNA_END=722 /DNA_ORIENTATION=+